MADCLKVAAATQLFRCCHKKKGGFSVTRSCTFLEKPEMEFLCTVWGFPDGSDGKESGCYAGDLGSIPGLRRSFGEGNGNPLQYSCLENSCSERQHTTWHNSPVGRILQLSWFHLSPVDPDLSGSTDRMGNMEPVGDLGWGQSQQVRGRGLGKAAGFLKSQAFSVV